MDRSGCSHRGKSKNELHHAGKRVLLRILLSYFRQGESASPDFAPSRPDRPAARGTRLHCTLCPQAYAGSATYRQNSLKTQKTKTQSRLVCTIKNYQRTERMMILPSLGAPLAGDGKLRLNAVSFFLQRRFGSTTCDLLNPSTAAKTIPHPHQLISSIMSPRTYVQFYRG